MFYSGCNGVTDSGIDLSDSDNTTKFNIDDIDDGSDLFGESLETADRDVGYTPTPTIIENNVDKILQSQRNLLSSSSDLVSDFKEKYTDALNEKIC